MQNRAYRRLSKEAWEAAGTAYLAGSTAEEVSAVYGMAVSTFRARAKDEGWRREDQPDPLREVLHREPGIVLQRVQDRPLEAVRRVSPFRHGHVPFRRLRLRSYLRPPRHGSEEAGFACAGGIA